jgi:5-(carboxyamino)imidazole ribonucleotide synthase
MNRLRNLLAGRGRSKFASDAVDAPFSEPAATTLVDPTTPALAPGGVIGLIGGGLINQPLAEAAGRLGFQVRTFDPRIEGLDRKAGPDSAWSGDHLGQLRDWASESDLLCNLDDRLDGRLVESLGRQVPMRPGLRVQRIARKRSRQVRLFERLGLSVPPGRVVGSVNELQMAMMALAQPAVLRANRPRGSDQAVIHLEDAEDAVCAWRALGAPEGWVQSRIEPAHQLIVLAGRSTDGQIALSGPIGRLDQAGRPGLADGFVWPAPIDQSIAMAALQLANRLAGRLELVGLISISLTVDRSGRIWADQIIPRPTVAGWLTSRSHATDQFAQHIRAIAGQPLGPNESHHAAAMVLLRAENMAGGPIHDTPLAGAPDVHFYRFAGDPADPDQPIGCLVATANTAEQALDRATGARTSELDN